ncbi:hypothetical protein [Granulicella sp. dw_53]|uniref:hypothetical protein n=1 Tax=Granulicella sp. dw_53 TaxID=2719792 RepID=UPI001BD336E6|nr:hypothetical protein [Granulicella sp. dw_53]
MAVVVAFAAAVVFITAVVTPLLLSLHLQSLVLRRHPERSEGPLYLLLFLLLFLLLYLQLQLQLQLQFGLSVGL